MTHTQFIQELVKKIQNKKVANRSDYYDPIKSYYDNLDKEDKRQFEIDLIGLLDNAEYRNWIISFCEDLDITESAEKIYQLVTTSHEQSEETWFTNAIIALGVFRYTKAKDFIKFCLDSLEVKDENTMHCYLLGLIPIAPLESTPYIKLAIISDSKQSHIYNGEYHIPDIFGALKKPPEEAKKIREEYDKHQELYAMVPTKQYLQYLLQSGGKRAIYKLARELRPIEMGVKEYFVRQLSYAVDWVRNGWLPLKGPILPFRGSKALFLNNIKLLIFPFKQLLEVRIKETLKIP